MLSRPKMLGMAFVFAGSLPLSPFAQTGAPDLSNAEVIVKSSVNTAFVAMTNTDAKGHFVLNGIPAGGINVLIRRNNQIIAQGAAIFNGGNLSEAQVLNILMPPSSNILKSDPGK
jgi:hypothetical protein